MKKTSLFTLLFTSALLLSACQKTPVPADVPPTADQLPPANEMTDENHAVDSEDRPTEDVSFNFDKVVEEDSGSSADPGSAEVSSMPVPAPDSDSGSVDEMVVAEAPAEAASTPEVKSFTMTAKQYEFVPGTITVNEGDTVRLTITSTDVEHGFALPQFGVSVDLQPGETQTVEFVADQAGTYTFFCNVFCGRGHGQMKGTLIVQ